MHGKSLNYFRILIWVHQL
uniref:Uncharacterized protein n=1 Tax=Arundo donax TaxID=35708 RepID=A0A0A8Z3R2_ARUDO